MNIACLGCTQFMYESSNIKVEGITKTEAIVYPSIHDIDLFNETIKESIGALGNSGGGVILFGCKKKDMEIIA